VGSPLVREWESKVLNALVGSLYNIWLFVWWNSSYKKSEMCSVLSSTGGLTYLQVPLSLYVRSLSLTSLQVRFWFVVWCFETIIVL